MVTSDSVVTKKQVAAWASRWKSIRN